jgi:hypothetical protein
VSGGLQILPLTAERWGDLEDLFGANGALGGCWCMWWRETRSEFSRLGNEGNRKAFKRLVESGQQVGVLGYLGDIPVAWCSIAPRQTYPSLQRSPVLRPLDDKPVWSLACIFIRKGHRKRGLGLQVIRGAIAHVAQSGGQIVEAYPTIPRSKELPPISSFMGTPAMFEAVGFKRVAQPSKSRAVYRYIIGDGEGT